LSGDFVLHSCTLKGLRIPFPLKVKLALVNATRDVNEVNELKAYGATIRDRSLVRLRIRI
jgi:hypothetical protein